MADRGTPEAAALLHDLRERVKELTALHGAASLLQDESLPSAEVLRRVALLLPPAFQFPADCAARVVHGEVAHATAGWKATPWLLRSPFGTSDGETGVVEVVYLRELPASAEGPFLAEERHLLDSLAEMVAVSLDRRKTVERLRLFVGTGRIRLFEWDVLRDRYCWPGIPGSGPDGSPGRRVMSREEVDRSIFPDDLPGLRRRVDAALSDPGREEIAEEYRSTVAHGIYTWRQLTARVIRGADGRAERVLGITVDISAQKALESRLRETQKMEALGRLAGGVAHDFNNILNAILGFAELAAGEIPESEPARGYVEEVGKAGRTGAALVRQILAFGRRQELRPRRVDLREAVADMDGMLKSLLTGRVELRREFAPDAPAALVDPNQFQQVVLNLCVNARDAMPEGGALTLRTRRSTAGAPRPDGSREAAREWAAFEVEDTGTGIPPEVLERIFEPFFTTKAEGKGTGLGLATVHGIVSASAGAVYMDSAPGRGTTFRIYFPRVEEEVETPEDPRTAGSVVGGTENLLVVEDDDQIRGLAVQVLRHYGYCVFEAATPTHAVEQSGLVAGPIDLMVIDAVLPGMSGADLADRIAAVHPEARALFISGYAAGGTGRHRVPRGAGRFLPKPFTPTSLLRAVRACLDAPAPSPAP